MTETILTLSKADAGKLQDAWHYAMVLIKREDSTFCDDREYPMGIRGEVRAYESLLSVMDQMADDNETWQFVRSQWWEPTTYEGMIANAAAALQVIEIVASDLGLDARIGTAMEGGAK